MRIATCILRNINWIELAFGVATVCLFASCSELKRPEPNPYLAETQPPPIQEFRWSNGPTPKSLDPAFAAAAPETDVVRAVYEGLTVVDPRTLEAVPAVAQEWRVSDDGKIWTFQLRKDAKWSNGRGVTANDFVRSWQRLNALGSRTAHRNLLNNFARVERPQDPVPAPEPDDFVESDAPVTEPSNLSSGDDDKSLRSDRRTDPAEDVQIDGEPLGRLLDFSQLDLKAPDSQTLQITLVRPDKDFPKLVAHPIFSPSLGDPKPIEGNKPDSKALTNGPFLITKIDDAVITLERSDTYWNRDAVKLDRIAFVSSTKPDEALEAYRTGKVDVVTNTDFAPLAQKVFSPYADFRKSAFAALNFYEINYRKPPFNDRRVREALAISIEREKLFDGELEGTTQPAFSFLPFSNSGQAKIVEDKDSARELLEQAGFADGVGFPMIRLVVNRNDLQQRIARAVARMWKSNLNIETEIIVKEPAELNEMRTRQDFDVLRRGVVLPVASQAASMSAILGAGDPNVDLDSNVAYRPVNANGVTNVQAPQPIFNDTLTESEALFELHAIPLYFPASFALVKPYVSGFEMNSLEVQSAASISIDSAWQPRMR